MMSNNYEDEQSEDGELARSPILDEMDFSLSDEDHANADSLEIKPPQAVIHTTRRRGHKKMSKDRLKAKDAPIRKEKKHQFRDRDKQDKLRRDLAKSDDGSGKDFYREKQFFRDRDNYRDKDVYREKEARDKEPYKEARDFYREKEIRDNVYREKEVRDNVYREKEIRDRDQYKETREKNDRDNLRSKEAYRDREHYKERGDYRENVAYRDTRHRELYREKDGFKEQELQRERESYPSSAARYADERRQRKETDRVETRLKGEDSHSVQNNQKENRDRSSGDKELEDLRSRLLSKRISKEIQSKDRKQHDNLDNRSDNLPLDRHQQERRKRLLEADREMEKRKHESRSQLEARREERRRRGKKRSPSLDTSASKRNKTEDSSKFEEAVVTVSDATDEEMKSDSAESEPEEGEHSKSDSETESSSTDTDSGAESKSEKEDDSGEEQASEKEELSPQKLSEISKSPEKKSEQDTPFSHDSQRSRSKSGSRSRSHSFSPPPPGENGKTETELEPTKEDEEEHRKREEEINALPPYFPALQGCRSVEEFQCLNRIEEGTYGVVYRARDKTTEEIVALKRLKMEKEKEGFPITSLREINTLLKGQHPNIVTVREIVVGSNMDKIFIVMDYVEHDLKSLMETMRNKKQVFLPGEVKCLMTQLLKAVHHLHDNWILHRDLKTSNLLLSHKGILKVGDFGLAREYGSPLRQYTPIVVTLWYRAPELLLCTKEYSTPIDMWSVGCIFAEFITMNPLFPGKSEVDQLNRIFKELGTPTELIWPGYGQLPAVQKMTFAEQPAGALRQRIGPDLLSEAGLALLKGFLTYYPQRRLAADAALEHAYFKEQPVGIDPAMFPTWPAKSEGGRRATASPRPPAGGAAPRDDLGFRVRSDTINTGFLLKF